MDARRSVREKAAGAPALAARARYFRVLGDPTRLELLEALLERERSVGELVAFTGAPRSRVSNHLACLKWCRFVTARRRGRHIVYEVADPRAGELLSRLKDLSVERCGYLVRCRRIGPDWI